MTNDELFYNYFSWTRIKNNVPQLEQFFLWFQVGDTNYNDNYGLSTLS